MNRNKKKHIFTVKRTETKETKMDSRFVKYVTTQCPLDMPYSPRETIIYGLSEEQINVAHPNTYHKSSDKRGTNWQLSSQRRVSKVTRNTMLESKEPRNSKSKSFIFLSSYK